MQSIRVLVGGLSGMLSDIIATLLDSQDDIKLLGEVADDAEMLEAIDRLRPDVVIVSRSDAELSEFGDELLRRLPTLRIIGVDAEGRRAVLHELRPHRVPLGELSAEGLLEAIRATAAQR